MLHPKWFILCFSMALCGTSDTSKILGFFVAPSRSHSIIHAAVMKELLTRGHNLTIVTTHHMNISEPSSNFREIYLDTFDGSDPMDILVKSAVDSDGSQKEIDASASAWGIPSAKFLIDLAAYSRDLIRHDKLQKLLNDSNEQFDLFVLGWLLTDFQLGIAGHFRCPSVVISTVAGWKPLRDHTGNPASIATVPLMTKGQSHKLLEFFERLKNFILYLMEYVMSLCFDYFIIEPYYYELFPTEKGYPTFEEVKRNVSLVLINHHFSLGGIRPMVPNFVEISGVHAKVKPNPLPEHLQTFLDGAEHGAILFSLGSNIKSSDLDEKKVHALLKAFGKLKQRVLWKWDTELLGIPENVIVSKWLPQDGILAHKNMRLFISHCGLGSVIEAKFYGVPILAIPFFADQPGNAESIVDEGWAILFSYNSISEASITAAIKEMIENPVYRDKVQRMSQLYRDRPVAPLDLAVYWIEYVLRYDGARHMQSPAVHLNFFQVHSLDVIAFLMVAAFVAYKLSFWIVVNVLGKIFRDDSDKAKTE